MTRAERSLVENPPWVTKILTDHWGDLEAKVKPAWLPKLDDVHAVRGGHVQGDFTEFGCGVYGCVYPTLDPGIVLKVTTDPTEAEFAANLAKDLVVPIVTTYRMVMSLPVKHERRRVYLLWREEASDVGAIEEDSTEDHLIYRQHKAAQAVYDILIEQTQGDLDTALESWKHEVRSMIMLPELRFLGAGLLKIYDQQQIFFGDIHAGNLGKVKRDGKDVWVITDPGHVAVLGDDDRQEMLAVANPHKEGVGRWKAPDIFGKSLNARMLRILWECRSMSQAEFMQRYHKVGASLEGDRRSTRLTEGKTAFLNNLGRYVRGHAGLPADWVPSQEGIKKIKYRHPGASRATTQMSVSGEGHRQLGLLREQAVRYLLPIVRTMNGERLDTHRRGWEHREKLRRAGANILLTWDGPTPDEWLTSLDSAELDKAYQSMEALAIESGDDLDVTWVKRLRDEVIKRSGGPADYHRRPAKNPARSIDELDTTVQALLRDPDPGAMDAIRDACLELGDFATILAGVGERMFAAAHKHDPNAKLKQWLLWNATFDVFAELEQEDPRGHFENQEDVAFARTADEYNVWPWCNVLVQATYGENVGEDRLGGCSYEDQRAFTAPGGAYDDMKRSAIDDLISEMPDVLVKTLSKNVVAGRFEISPMKNLGQVGAERSVEWFLWERSVPGYHVWQRTYLFEYKSTRWNFAFDYGGDFADNVAYAAVGAYMAIPALHMDREPETVQHAITKAMRDSEIKRLVEEGGFVAKASRRKPKR